MLTQPLLTAEKDGIQPVVEDMHSYALNKVGVHLGFRALAGCSALNDGIQPGILRLQTRRIQIHCQSKQEIDDCEASEG